MSRFCFSLTLFAARLRTIQQNMRDSQNHEIAGAAFPLLTPLCCVLLVSHPCALVEVATAACFVAQTRNGALALTSLGLPAVCLNLLECQVEGVQLASCRLLLGNPQLNSHTAM
jgi:hypothetical protein